MTKKIYRRFLLAGIMLLISVFLMSNGPTQQAAEETCDECNARCEALGQSCLDQGYPLNVCMHVSIQCSSDCLYGVCSQ